MAAGSDISFEELLEGAQKDLLKDIHNFLSKWLPGVIFYLRGCWRVPRWVYTRILMILSVNGSRE